MQRSCLPSRLLLLAALLFYSLAPAGAQFRSRYNTEPSFKDGGPLQIGFKASYLMPRNEFGMDFKRAPAYELYCQFRNKGGAGNWTARLGVFYTSLKPRLDTIPSYLVRENPTMLFPGYIVYKKLTFMGLSMDYAYSVVHYKGFRMDLGLGLLVGKYHQEYEQAYPTIIITNGSVDDLFAGLRGRINLGYQLNNYVELCAETLDAFITSKDWSSQFNHTSLSLGVNVSLKPARNDY